MHKAPVVMSLLKKNATVTISTPSTIKIIVFHEDGIPRKETTTTRPPKSSNDELFDIMIPSAPTVYSHTAI